MKVPANTTIDGFWALFPAGAKLELSDLAFSLTEVRETTLQNLGDVRFYIGECTDGVDRGGYVQFVELLGVVGPNGDNVILEGETDESEWMFFGRSGILRDLR